MYGIVARVIITGFEIGKGGHEEISVQNLAFWACFGVNYTSLVSLLLVHRGIMEAFCCGSNWMLHFGGDIWLVWTFLAAFSTHAGISLQKFLNKTLNYRTFPKLFVSWPSP